LAAKSAVIPGTGSTVFLSVPPRVSKNSCNAGETVDQLVS
jgi:hypothetical protein